MRLYTRKQIREAMPQIEALLKSFADSTKANELFFASCQSYVLSSQYVYCSEDEGGNLTGIGYIITPFGVPNLGMAVDPSLQGRGIGNHIMGHVLGYTATKNSVLVSCLWKDNIPIINLHRNYAFRLMYAGRKADWWIWSKESEDWELRRWLLAKALPLYDIWKYH